MHGWAGVIIRHCEPTGRANARPMTGSAKQSLGPLAELDCVVARAPRNDASCVTTGETYGAFLSPNFACNSGHSRSRLNGTAVKRMPGASANAMPIRACRAFERPLALGF